MKRIKPVSRDDVLHHMLSLATNPANDALRLAFLAPEQEDIIPTLDLSGLTEFKRNANGSVELKFINRLAILQKVAELVQNPLADPASFLHALDHIPHESDGSPS